MTAKTMIISILCHFIILVPKYPIKISADTYYHSTPESESLLKLFDLKSLTPNSDLVVIDLGGAKNLFGFMNLQKAESRQGMQSMMAVISETKEILTSFPQMAATTLIPTNFIVMVPPPNNMASSKSHTFLPMLRHLLTDHLDPSSALYIIWPYFDDEEFCDAGSTWTKYFFTPHHHQHHHQWLQNQKSVINFKRLFWHKNTDWLAEMLNIGWPINSNVYLVVVTNNESQFNVTDHLSKATNFRHNQSIKTVKETNASKHFVEDSLLLCNNNNNNSRRPTNLTAAKLFELYSIRDVHFFKEIFVTTSQTPVSKIRFDDITSGKLRRRNDFEGIEIVAVAFNGSYDWDEHFSTDLGTEGKPQYKLLKGSGVDIYRSLRDMLNFSEKAIPVKNRENKSYELLTDGTAQIYITQVSIQESRAQFVKFLQPSDRGMQMLAFFRQPPSASLKNIYITPFKPLLWLYMAVTWILLLVTMIVLSQITHRLKNPLRIEAQADTVGAAGSLDNPIEILFWAISVMCQKCWVRLVPVDQPMRIIFLSTLLMSIVLHAAYVAVLYSALSLIDFPVTEFLDLVTNSYNFYAHERSGAAQSFLNGSVIAEYKLKQPVLTTDDKGELDILIEPDQPINAFLSFPHFFYNAALHRNLSIAYVCSRIDSVPASRYPLKTSMSLKIGDPFAETFNHKILMMKERGFDHRLYQKYTVRTLVECPKKSSKSRTRGYHKELGFGQISIPFLILSAGFGVGLFLVGVEQIHRHIVEHRLAKLWTRMLIR